MPHTLLLADDSVTIQRVIELTFADEDVQVVAVGDGDAAIAVIDRTPPDIVLADVGMPGRNGYDVAQHVKRTPRLAHIPVVLLTGAFEPIDRERADAAGCDGVLAKPFEPQTVIGRVKELLARPRVVLPPAPPPSPAVDRYFDELDEAFATLTSTRPAGPGAGSEPTGGTGTRPVDAPRDSESPVEWFAAEGSATVAAPREGFEVPAAPVSASTRPPRVPPLAEAFAALLAAEESSRASGNPAPPAPSWPTMAAGAVPGPVSDDTIALVVQQVLERMSDRIVREVATDLVSTIAERLVREEIERIKANAR